jgi:hypothetical protein
MAEIEIGPLSERLTEDEIADLVIRMEKLGVSKLNMSDDEHVDMVGEGLDENVLTEFLDRLDGHEVAAEIYLPVEFDGSFEVASLRVASAPMLLDVLEELKDELEDEEDEMEEEDYDEDERLMTQQLREAWKLFYQGAKGAIERQLPLHVRT